MMLTTPSNSMKLRMIVVVTPKVVDQLVKFIEGKEECYIEETELFTDDSKKSHKKKRRGVYMRNRYAKPAKQMVMDYMRDGKVHSFYDVMEDLGMPKGTVQPALNELALARKIKHGPQGGWVLVKNRSNK